MTSKLEQKRAKRLPPGTPNPIDVHVGKRIRLRRTLLGISQERLGDALGLTFQQVQKYERGANRIGASRVYEISQILDVPISFLYEDLPGEYKTPEGRYKAGLRDKAEGRYEADPLSRRETLEMVRAYYRISDLKVRKRLFEMIKSLGQP